jgi:large subunit ribosomal protein L15
MFELNKLRSSGKDRKRVGRGGSRGGTSGKGHKGQSARSGGTVTRGFEGGQMPLHRRLPKRGFNNAQFREEFSIINLGQLEQRFNDKDVITVGTLIKVGLVRPKMSASEIAKRGVWVKLLGNGVLKKKLTIQVHACSDHALKAVEQAGGTVELIARQNEISHH